MSDETIILWLIIAPLCIGMTIFLLKITGRSKSNTQRIKDKNTLPEVYKLSISRQSDFTNATQHTVKIKGNVRKNVKE